MVARLGKFCVCLFLSCFSLPLISGENNIEEAVLSLAVREVQKSMVALGHRIDECDKKEKTLNIDSLSLPSVNEKTMFLAFLHLNTKARDSCEGDLWAKFSHSLGDYNDVISHYDIKEREVFKYEVLTNHAWKNFEMEVKYNNIDPKIRGIFESNPEFLTPFDPLKLLRKVKQANKTH